MNFRRRLVLDEPEINLIPLIDVLLVILIFLAVTTSFTRLNQLAVDLPEAAAMPVETDTLALAITADGHYTLEGQSIPGEDPQVMAGILRTALRGRQEAVLLIRADAQSTHLAVVRALQAARLAGISRVDFATQAP